MRRVGIFGGSFNPIHIGHLRAAEEVREAQSLHRVLFVPAAIPPHKSRRYLASPAQRLEMVRLAISGNRAFAVSDIELQRRGRSYSIDTLRELRARFPDWQLHFIVGLDAFAEIDTWREFEGLFELSHFVVVSRPGIQVRPLRQLLPVVTRNAFWYAPDGLTLVHRSGHTVVFQQITGFDVSATAIRQALLQGRSIRYLVPKPVERYILRHGLYQGRSGVS
ncbi:MAG: putative nicotinate-nucleotide adenylyltransferase [Candidatus Binatia bacterium]|nr:MAG: putative nicotinate-nucleotide adenylyltransferase [Candidatus Binatia bacterium]